METSHYGELHKLFDTNFLDYTSYVIRERAIPDVADGLKPVQRRILQTLFNMDDGRFHKVANVVGDCMKLHPHGDASIFSALVNLANKGYLIDRQGNFGNIFTGDQASAARYIECRLSPLARETLFNKDLTEFTDSYDGRMQEPVALPAKIPLLLMQGAEGIAVGMATKIMPHNFCELLEAQKNILRDEPFTLYPDFLLGGAIDVSGYEDGNGRIRCRARIEEKNEKTITIKDIPYGTTTQSLIESVEKAARANKLKILSINDYTAEEVEIEIKLVRGIYAADTIKALYAFTDCEVPISPNLTVIVNNNPAVLTVSEVLRHNTEKLVRDLKKELSIEHGRLKEKLHAHLLEQIFIEERLYKEIEECKTYKAVVETIGEALLPYRDKLVREVTTEDIERLLEIRIKRISRYDLDKKKKDIKEVRDNIKAVENYLLDMIGYTITYLDDLLNRYGHLYPRRTEIATFGEVEVRKVALSNLTMGYDRETGFLGHQVKARPEDCFPCSEYDKLLLIFQNGMYKVINVIDKLFVGHDVLWCGKVEEKKVFNILYREGSQNLCYIKRFNSPKFILEKEYRLFPEHKNSAILFLSTGDGGRVRVHLAPSKRARHNFVDCSFNEVLIKGASALGKRVSDRPVRRIAELPAEKEPAGVPEVQPTLFPAKEGEPQTTSQPTEVSGPGQAESNAPETEAE
ncbi:MAG: DNA topoisomerase IV subunit A [Proteobacteria bacterium]|nr:DNA topoisomerase IV subunit A [Pseudomonadota bacterium]MBU1545894.1 DNA topoisomerase IV subunit A [Pseudomonadota bacterium]MBU2618944.1 DNA topoisomerase IV subunit A [Pseudomonadota bacterium]